MDKEQAKFSKDFKIWKACDTNNENRPCLEYIIFDHGYAYATDAHILAKVNLRTLTGLEEEEVNKLNGFCIHKDMYKILVGRTIEEITDDETPSIVCRIKANTFSFALYPNDKIQPPKFDEVLRAEGEHHPIEKIGIHGKLLNNLTEAIGQSRVKMDFFTESSKIIVTPIDADYLDVKGLIMPVMIDGSFDFEQPNQ